MSTALPWVPPTVEPTSTVEAQANVWISGYDQAEHLRRARDWLVYLQPEAATELRIAALTHDIERMFPGGPQAASGWDDPFYLYPHMLRSAEFVSVWLANLGATAATVDIAKVRRLVGLHEVGGRDGADELQAADSLSFLETLTSLACHWVRTGSYSRHQAADKLHYMAGRVRLRAASQHAEQLLQWALAQLPTPQSARSRS